MTYDPEELEDLEDLTTDDAWKLNLHNGDEVYWNDPDDGRCSRILKVSSIVYKGDFVSIEEQSGAVVECFLSELS